MRRTEFRAQDEILLTADTGDALAMYTLGLERQGFTVFPTRSTSHAVTFVRRGRPPNAVVVVMSLRERDAWNAIDPLLGSAADAQVPLVIVTPSVRADGRHRRTALDRGCAAFLALPCAPDELSAVVRRVLAGEMPIVSPPLRSERTADFSG